MDAALQLGLSRLYFFVYRYASPNFSEKLEPIEVTHDIPVPSSNSEQQVACDFTLLSEASRTFTVNSGDDIAIGYAYYRNVPVVASRPFFVAYATETELPPGQVQYTLAVPGGASGDNLPTPTDSEAGNVCRWAMRKLVLETNAQTITSDTAVFSGATTIREVPASNDNYWVILEDCFISDLNTLTVDFQHVDGSAGMSLITASLNFTTDVASFGGQTVSPNTGASEASDSFDFYFYMKPSTKSIDWFYANRTTGQGPEGSRDLAIISHTSKRFAERGGTLPTMARMPSQVSISATGGSSNVERLYVCRKPVVILGDSQSIDHVARIGGQLPSDFIHDRVGISAAISGNRISETAVGAHTRGDKRYCSDTPGLGDICDMRDIILAITNYAANDLPNGQTVDQIVDAHEAIITDAIGHGNEVILLGITPLADFHADVSDNFTRTLLNNRLQDLATANGIAWFNPYDGVLANQATYLDSGGLHLNQAGSGFVASQLVLAYEEGESRGSDTHGAGAPD